MSGFHQEVYPKDEHLYFNDNMRQMIRSVLKQQIVENENNNLAVGQGIFILDELTTKDNKSRFNIAVHCAWKYDTANKQFTGFEIFKHHLFSGDLPDEVLDEINVLQEQGTPEWKEANINPNDSEKQDV